MYNVHQVNGIVPSTTVGILLGMQPSIVSRAFPRHLDSEAFSHVTRSRREVSANEQFVD